VQIDHKFGSKGAGQYNCMLFICTNNKDSLDHRELRERILNIRVESPIGNNDRELNSQWIINLLGKWSKDEQDEYMAWMLRDTKVPSNYFEGKAVAHQAHLDDIIEEEELYTIHVQFKAYLNQWPG